MCVVKEEFVIIYDRRMIFFASLKLQSKLLCHRLKRQEEANILNARHAS